MAKAKKQVSFEDALWSSCDKLRGIVEAAENKLLAGIEIVYGRTGNTK